MKKMAWFLSLILCLVAFFVSPSAQAEEIEKVSVQKVQNLKVQADLLISGESYNPGEWTLHDGTGERKFTAHVDFEEAYKQQPAVVVSLAGLAIDKSANTRFKVRPINITEKGFDVEYKTWEDSKNLGFLVNWTAFGGK